MSETDPIVQLRPRKGASQGKRQDGGSSDRSNFSSITRFNRAELSALLDVYGRKVASGEWRDYAIDMGRDIATFSIFRRSSECPLYKIEKVPKLARKQGAYRVVAASGQILRRGHDLKRVLGVLDRPMQLVR